MENQENTVISQAPSIAEESTAHNETFVKVETDVLEASLMHHLAEQEAEKEKERAEVRERGREREEEREKERKG